MAAHVGYGWGESPLMGNILVQGDGGAGQGRLSGPGGTARLPHQSCQMRSSQCVTRRSGVAAGGGVGRFGDAIGVVNTLVRLQHGEGDERALFGRNEGARGAELFKRQVSSAVEVEA
jgi:hypothetical protein